MLLCNMHILCICMLPILYIVYVYRDICRHIPMGACMQALPLEWKFLGGRSRFLLVFISGSWRRARGRYSINTCSCSTQRMSSKAALTPVLRRPVSPVVHGGWRARGPRRDPTVSELGVNPTTHADPRRPTETHADPRRPTQTRAPPSAPARSARR